MNLLNFRDDYLLKRYRSKNKKVLIEMQLEKALNLFDQRDPAPLRERDIHESVIRHITESLSEFPPDQQISIAFYFREGIDRLDAEKCEKAFRQFFRFERHRLSQELKKQMMLGLKALGMGLVFLFVYTLASFHFKDRLDQLLPSFFVEVLHVLGWVSLWPAIFIFLYELSPLRDQRQMIEKISEAELSFSNTPYQGDMELENVI